MTSAGPRPRQRGQLVAERLARAGRHHGKRVLAAKDAVDDLPLNAAEAVEAEGLFEDRVRVGHQLFLGKRAEQAAIDRQ